MVRKITDSEFYMWRTLLAIAHADGNFSPEEKDFMSKNLEGIDFSPSQTEILKRDIIEAQNPDLMFEMIDARDDRLKFFRLARDLVWVDGSFGEEEQRAMIKLHHKHVHSTNVDDLIGKVALRLEDEKDEQFRIIETEHEDIKKSGFQRAIYSFRKRFLEEISKNKE